MFIKETDDPAIIDNGITDIKKFKKLLYFFSNIMKSLALQKTFELFRSAWMF